MGFRLLQAFALLGLLWAHHPVHSAEITLRPDLADRLKTLYPIYGELPPGQSIYFDAMFQEAPENPMVILIEGEIQKGDADKLAPLLEQYRHRFVFLNSPGGNFLEGLKLGELLQEQRDGNGGVQLLGAVVLKEHHCLSACALAYALATLPRDSGFPVRYIEQGATLGFHMGLLPDHLADRTASVRDSMNLTYDVVAKFTALIRGGVTPPALLENALHYRDAQSFYYLKGGVLSRFMGFTPVSSGTASIPLYGYGLGMNHVATMCQILYFSSPGNMLTGDEKEWYALDFEGTSPLPAGMSLQDATKHLGSPRLKNSNCVVELRNDQSIGISVSFQDRSDCLQNRIDGWCGVRLGDNPGINPNATVGLLADIFRCHEGQLADRYYTWSWNNTFADEAMGYDPTPLKREAKTARSVNLRSSPSLEGSVVAELAAGTDVSLQSCQLVNDKQGVWLQVATRQGTGWLSARFLEHDAAYFTPSRAMR